MDIENKPQLSLANSVTLPGRSLIVVCVRNNLELDQSGQIYEVEPSQYMIEEYPNLCIIPMIHNVDAHKTENVPLVVINLLNDDVYLSKGDVIGFMQNQSLGISGSCLSRIFWEHENLSDLSIIQLIQLLS